MSLQQLMEYTFPVKSLDSKFNSTYFNTKREKEAGFEPRRNIYARMLQKENKSGSESASELDP